MAVSSERRSPVIGWPPEGYEDFGARMRIVANLVTAVQGERE